MDDSPGAWYERAFAASYRNVYRHRTDAEADRDIARAARMLGWVRGQRILDLCCGDGRHAAALARVGLEVFGLDLSSDLLLRAASRSELCGRLVRADMRDVPLIDGCVDLVTSFFTSFGYFSSEREDLRVLEEVARVLSSEGRFLLDFLNAARVRESLVPRSLKELDGIEILEERRITGDDLRVEKTVTITHPTGRSESYVESVRLYGPEDFRRMFTAAGFRLTATFGDLDGRAHSDDAERLILVGHRA